MRARPLQSFRLGAAWEGVGGGGDRQGREPQEWGPSQDLGCWAAAPSGVLNLVLPARVEGAGDLWLSCKVLQQGASAC